MATVKERHIHETPKPDTPPQTEVSSGSSAEESALLDRLCEKAKQLYMVEPVESENGLTILVHKQIPAKTPDSASEWRRLGTAESFDNRYDRLADQISFFDETTGVVGTPFVDPWYTNFIRTEDAGQTWDFAEKELLENMPDSTVAEECQYAVLNLHCELMSKGCCPKNMYNSPWVLPMPFA